MHQPIKKSIKQQNSYPKTVKKNIKEKDKRLPSVKKEIVKRLCKKNHPEYGTSKLESHFATNFLDKLGVEYTYQYKAESIGRYFDFRIGDKGPIIEIQGSYWHGDNRLYEEKSLNTIQKKNIKTDKVKKDWCRKNGIEIIYIWELDINKNPESIMTFLREKLKKYIKKDKRLI